MTDMRRLLERQAEWQKTRNRLSWPEKVRMAEAVRESLRQFRRAPSERTGPPSRSGAATSSPGSAS